MNRGRNWTQADIEHIVSLVVDRLIGPDTTHAPTGQPIPQKFAAPPKHTRPTTTQPKNNNHSAADLVLSERLITLETLRNRLKGIQSVQVASGAIVTPAVRDELKDRGVALVVADNAPTASPLSKLAVLACGEPGDLSAWSQLVSVEREAEPHRAVSRAVNLTRQTGLAILLCQDAAASACLANRNSGIRALAAPATSGLESAMRAIGANLVIVDPATLAAGGIEDFLHTVARSRGLSAPAWWKE
ncbi:MAG: hypothetical protein WD045_03075 [Pirellulaceae bacterium]